MDDDVALIWLADQRQTPAVASYLDANAKGLFIDRVLAGPSLLLAFNDPRSDGRTPDLIVQPVAGTIYSTSKKKISEHGGLAEDDTHVALVLSNPGLRPHVIKTPVVTSQVAPTILEALGLDPETLKAVRIEGTRALPGL
jgi:hypothetical protein